MAWEDAQITRQDGMQTQLLEMGEMVCARHKLRAGFDSAPLYREMPGGMCPCEHWCYLVSGELLYRFTDGTSLRVSAGDAFHLAPGHLAEVLSDAELIELTAAVAYREKASQLAPPSG